MYCCTPNGDPLPGAICLRSELPALLLQIMGLRPPPIPADAPDAEPEKPKVCRWCKGTRQITVNFKTKPCEECSPKNEPVLCVDTPQQCAIYRPFNGFLKYPWRVTKVSHTLMGSDVLEAIYNGETVCGVVPEIDKGWYVSYYNHTTKEATILREKPGWKVRKEYNGLL